MVLFKLSLSKRVNLEVEKVFSSFLHEKHSTFASSISGPSNECDQTANLWRGLSYEDFNKDDLKSLKVIQSSGSVYSMSWMHAW
jgi:hypothetical protein